MDVPRPFDLDLTVRSHGWYDLPPWRYDRERRVLGRPFLVGRRGVYVEVAPAGRAEWGLALRVIGPKGLSPAQARKAKDAMRTCLSLDQDLSPFYGLIAQVEKARRRGESPDLPPLAWAAERGAGRLLRSPTVFEDAVKTLCTTNCSWGLTRSMISKLCDRLGFAAPLGTRCFPTPAAMVAPPESFYRSEIRAGYRAPFLRHLAREVAAGRIDIESWREPELSTGELSRRIRELPGFGPYATEHLLKLLGRYDFLALDSWCRGKLARLRGSRRPPADSTVARWFRPYGAYAGLALWLHLTGDTRSRASETEPANPGRSRSEDHPTRR